MLRAIHSQEEQAQIGSVQQSALQQHLEPRTQHTTPSCRSRVFTYMRFISV